ISTVPKCPKVACQKETFPEPGYSYSSSEDGCGDELVRDCPVRAQELLKKDPRFKSYANTGSVYSADIASTQCKPGWMAHQLQDLPISTFHLTIGDLGLQVETLNYEEWPSLLHQGCDKTLTKANFGEERVAVVMASLHSCGTVTITFVFHVYHRGKSGRNQSRNLEAGPEADAMKECFYITHLT
ncbi:hypothetical protein STEG23_001234, partial [Scotinomys teguina]